MGSSKYGSLTSPLEKLSRVSANNAISQGDIHLRNVIKASIFSEIRIKKYGYFIPNKAIVQS
jgi:hypothetical protein